MGRLVVRAQPGARRSGFVGWFGDLPKYAIEARPVDGAANEALERELAKAFGLGRGAIRLVGGTSSRTKRFEIDGLDEGEIAERVESMNPR